MPVIRLQTEIDAPIERVFNLSRSIDLHKDSLKHTKEKAVAGKTSGLISMGETVTWEAIHFGVKQRLTSKITGYKAPFFLEDQMVSGAFKSFVHQHHFKEIPSGTLLIDDFQFVTPLGIVGRICDYLFLYNYMKRILTLRNKAIKEYAELFKDHESASIAQSTNFFAIFGNANNLDPKIKTNVTKPIRPQYLD